jgi:hypothetical protein
MSIEAKRTDKSPKIDKKTDSMFECQKQRSLKKTFAIATSTS